MKKVLLTGATGFIGRHAIPSLIARGFEVHAVTSKATSQMPDCVHKHHIDLFNPDQRAQLVAGITPTHLLHFAWYAVPGKFWTSSENLKWVSTSIQLLKEFVDCGGKRIVMAGTCAEYDWNPPGICNELTTSIAPATLYGACKASLYQIMSAYTKQMGVSQAWGRIFHLYGPDEYPERLAPSVIKSFLRQEVARCSHGTQIRDIMYVEDVADAFVALLDSDVQGAVNIASGQAVTLKEFINQIAFKLNGKVEFGALSPSLSDPLQLLADTQRLFREVKWQPKYSFDSGLNKTIASWKS